jgi:hypothetical protein
LVSAATTGTVTKYSPNAETPDSIGITVIEETSPPSAGLGSFRFDSLRYLNSHSNFLWNIPGVHGELAAQMVREKFSRNATRAGQGKVKWDATNFQTRAPDLLRWAEKRCSNWA